MTMPLARFAGLVVHGDGRGRHLGFPTANLNVSIHDSISGIYAAWVRINREDYWRQATVSVGENPTFDDLHVARLECFVHDFDDNLYGHWIEVVLVTLVRRTQAFSSIDELVDQARRDVTLSRRILSTISQPSQ